MKNPTKLISTFELISCYIFSGITFLFGLISLISKEARPRGLCLIKHSLIAQAVWFIILVIFGNWR